MDTKHSSYQKHKKQAFWQIWFPALVLALVVLFLGGLAVLGSYGQASLWADAAWVWLLAPWLLLLLLPLALVWAAVYGMHYALNVLAKWSAEAQKYAARAPHLARQTSDKVTAPLIKMAAWKSALRRLFMLKGKE